MIRIVIVACVGVLGSMYLPAQDVEMTVPDAEAQLHIIKPHQTTFRLEGVRGGMNSLHLVLSVSASGFVTHAEANGEDKLMKYWPQLQGVVGQWQYTPFLKDGQPIAATIEEYVSLVPPERLPTMHVSPPALRPDSKVSFTLERSACMGSCPAYTVTASTDDVDFEGRWYVVATGKHVAPVDPDAVRKLAKEAITRDFYSMAPQYEANVTDCPSYTLSLSVDGVRKQVIDYMGMWEGMPAVISDLEEAVDDLAGTERWTQGKVGLVSALKAEKWDFATFGAQQMLKQAAVRGQVDSVRELLEAGVPLKPVPEPKLVSADPRTSALNEGWLQAASGHRDVLEVLLAAGASKDDQLDKNLALSNAASTGDITAARALIAYGANPNADLSKLTVVEGRSMSSSGPGLGNILTYAAESGNPAMVSEILKYRPKLETHGREGKTAIFAAAEYEGDATDEDRAECVRLLAKAGANVNAHDSDGNTPLHETFLVPVIEELISLGANVNARNKDGETPIFTNVSAEAMAVFAAHGADFTVRNHKGQTVIEAAEQRGPIMQEALLAAMRSQLGR